MKLALMSLRINLHEMFRVIMFGSMEIDQHRYAVRVGTEGFDQGGFDLFGIGDAYALAALALCNGCKIR